MADQLSGIAIIICIAFGVLTFILLFIFAKRQITRFALKSRQGPHVSVGVDAPKHLCQEIERRFERVNKIRCEPCLLTDEENLFENHRSFPQNSPAHHFRMRVIHEIKALDIYIRSFDVSKMRCQGDDVQTYYLQLHKAGFLVNLSLSTLYQFLELYELARHEPQDFSHAEYTRFCELLQSVKNCISISAIKWTNPATGNSKDDYQNEESTKWYVDDYPGVLHRNNVSCNESAKRKLSFETSV